MEVLELNDGDVIKATEDGTVVRDLHIVDTRPPERWDDAHVDVVQGIGKWAGRYNTQFACACLDRLVVRDCKMESPGKAQLVFCSDGGMTNVGIHDNVMDTRSQHFISGCIISGQIYNNRDSSGKLVPIHLYPMRVGGNADGKFNIFILSFKDNTIEYMPKEQLVLDDTLDHVTDYRFGVGKRPGDVYLYGFDVVEYKSTVASRQMTALEMRTLALDYGTQEEPKMITPQNKKQTPIDIAYLQLGQKEIKGGMDNPVIVEYFRATSYHATDDETPWCSAAHCWVHEVAAVAHTKSAAAMSWVDWGVRLEKPVKGCTIIGDHDNGKGHVGFYLGEDATTYTILGGNQGDTYCISRYSKKSFVRWHFRGQKKAAGSKMNWTGVGTAVVGGGIALPGTNDMLGGDLLPETVTTKIDTIEHDPTLKCEGVTCPINIPEGYIAVPELVFQAGMLVGVVLIIAGIFVIKDRLTKMRKFGI